MKFLLDTNFLLIPAQFKVDIFSELGKFGKSYLYTLNLVVEELDRLGRSRGRKGRQARFTLDLLKKQGIQIIVSGSRSTDAAIIKSAKESGLTVCTQDKALIRKLHSKGIPVVTMRQKKYLVMK